MLTETFVLCGQPELPAALIPLRAGPLVMLFDPTCGFVRRLRWGRHEVLRGIYAAVRDHNWDTVPGVLRERARAVGPDSFRLEFESSHQRGDVDFLWRGVLRGEANGTVTYALAGEARSTFRRNRIGFCVLHPIQECAGAAARQRRVDDSVVESRFPAEIEPQIFGRAGFRDLRGLAHQVGDGLWAELEFEGDTFEMEDQRNWTDASFKTYCTPLALPFPVEITRGTVVRQTVTLRLADDVAGCSSAPITVTDPDPARVMISLPDDPVRAMPQLGLGVASHGEPLTELETGLLRRLRLAHLRVDLRLNEPSWPQTLEQAAVEAARLDARLELAVHWPRQGEVGPIETNRLLQPHLGLVARVLALREGEAATSPKTLQQVQSLLGQSAIPVGAGSDCNFCEFNRERALGRLALAEADFLFWSVNPQVHAFDHRSVMETLEAQAATLQTAQAFADGRPLMVSPVTLRQRFNPVATGSPQPVVPGQLPPPVDPRQLSLFAAAWTLGSLATLLHSGAAGVTLYETTGWRGVMEREQGSPLPDQFPSVAGAPFPLYHVLAAIAGCMGFSRVGSDRPDQVTGLALVDADGSRRVLLANLGAEAVRVCSPEVAASVPTRVLDARAAAAPVYQPDGFSLRSGQRPGLDPPLTRASLPHGGGVGPSDQPSRALAAGHNPSRKEPIWELDLPPYAVVHLDLTGFTTASGGHP